jgi:hypothetical protein
LKSGTRGTIDQSTPGKFDHGTSAFAPDAPAYHGDVFGFETMARLTMIKTPIRSTLLRRAAFAALALCALAACQKNDAAAGQTGAKLDDAAQQAARVAGQKLDQAVSFVGQQVDKARQSAQQNVEAAAARPSIKLDASEVAATAQAHLHGAATNAALGQAASATGFGLQVAGRKLQQWGSETAAASGTATASGAQKQRDK